MNPSGHPYTPLFPVSGTGPSQTSDTIDLGWLLGVVRRALPLVAVSIFAALVLAAIYLASAQSTYVSSAKILLGGNSATPILPEVSPAPARMTTDAEILSQIEILESKELARRVAEATGLADDADFINRQASLSGRLKRGVKVILGMEEPRKGPPMEVMSPEERVGYAASLLQRDLDISRAGRSFALNISYRSNSAERAEKIASAYTNIYTSDQVTATGQANMQAALWLQNRLADIGDRVARNDLELQDLRAEYNQTADGAAMIELRRLEQRSESLRSLYNTFLQRSQEVEQQQGFPVSAVRVISPASKPSSPATPKTVPTIALALFAGGALGGLLALAMLLREAARFSTGEDVEKVLGVRFLGYYPKKAGDRHRKWRPVDNLERKDRLRSVLVSQTMAETRAAIDSAGAGNPSGASPNIVGVASPFPGTNRLPFVRQFAAYLEQSGATVDMRSASVQGEDNDTGLPVRPRHHQDETADLAGGVHMGSAPDYTIVDLAPLGVSAPDRSIFSKLTSIIVVVDQQESRRGFVRKALRELDADVDLAGLVLAGADPHWLLRRLGPERRAYFRSLFSGSDATLSRDPLASATPSKPQPKQVDPAGLSHPNGEI